MTPLRHSLEGFFLSSLWWGLRRLPPATASSFMGALGRSLGPLLPPSRIAHVNLRIAFPHATLRQRRQIIRACWDNLGRNIGEFPHIPSLPHNMGKGPGWRVEGEEHLLEAYQSHRPIIFFSGHLGNWELMPVLVARYGLPFASIYRAPNNPKVNQLILEQRQKNLGVPTPIFPKGAKGAREAYRYLAHGGHLGILGDQKMNDGILATLFGQPSMTTSAAATFALRFDALIVTGHVQREGNAKLVLKVDPPIEINSKSDNKQETIHYVTQDLNDRLQSWIENKPGSWLWLHRRWDKKLYK
ncbi:lauroyl acyltransferase [Saccharibacter sp. 17.LH.SD]|uniref:lysophospholipid acyltransferase family protein n=1 Tax=Saccharibacter sp. 17.LH.SD TaxID=2689393 RepID=UPI00136CF795|nr:lauroyl acyltransferase [Saccharibacter sp. 17.LH.SD]MXV44528.1 lauroyl acyltransferase [Saccharibacter sp. 17.LH.SD]